MCVRKFFLKLVIVFSFTSNIPFSRLPAPDMRLVNLVTRAFPLKNGRSSPGDEVGVTCHSALNIASYDSFKIFTPFWLAKSTRIIHHNQLLMTKFGGILGLNRWRQKCRFLAGLCTVKRENLGTRLSCFGCEKKNGGHFTRFKSKN